MNTVCVVYKPPFVTPLEALDEFRKTNPEYQNATLGYAGRLDPLAQGLLLILVNDENKKRKEYERMPKEYTCKALLGIATDSYDYMGIFTQTPQSLQINPKDKLQEILPSFIGKQQQPYPLYSSARVNGKPLYYWAREKKTDIQIPTKQIEIYELTCTNVEKIPLSIFASSAIDGVSKVHGEFRQKEIIQQWQKYTTDKTSYYSADLFIRCSSGTYVRGIVDDLGKRLQTGALAYNIIRTKVGSFSLLPKSYSFTA